MPFLKLGTRLRGLRPAELAKKCLVARDEQFDPELTAEGLGRVGGLRHFRVLRNGGPPGSRSEERESLGIEEKASLPSDRVPFQGLDNRLFIQQARPQQSFGQARNMLRYPAYQARIVSSHQDQ